MQVRDSLTANSLSRSLGRVDRPNGLCLDSMPISYYATFQKVTLEASNNLAVPLNGSRIGIVVWVLV
jgi:hypothetical protein